MTVTTLKQEPVFQAVDPQAGAGIGLDGFNLDTVMRIPVLLQVVLGSASIPVANLLKLSRGAVIQLDHKVGEPVDVVVNGRVIAKGEIVVVDEVTSRFGISLTEIVAPPSGAAAG
jgi:flagellar motor switch protein FliN/FliY